MQAVPFNRPSFAGNEQRYIAQAIENKHISGDGGFTKSSQKVLEETLGVGKALLTTSCSHALEMAALLLDLQAGDEVIVPSFTFVTSASAFVLRGARPVFVDIRADTLNIDERLLEQAIGPRTKAIVVVHYAGVGCEMDVIMDIARRHRVAVIEDNAHGLFASYKGRPLGSFGTLATQSFHETKNLTCGEGGALLINDAALFEQAEIIRDKGTNRARFFRGQVDKYTWVALGSSYPPSEILAAYLYAQLEAREQIQAKRRAIWERYARGLQAWAAGSDVALPYIPAYCEQAYHMFYLLMPSLQERQAFIRYLAERQINAVFHYVPLHRSEMSVSLGASDADCPVTDDVSDRLVRLPFFNQLSESDQDRVIDAICAYAV